MFKHEYLAPSPSRVVAREEPIVQVVSHRSVNGSDISGQPVVDTHLPAHDRRSSTDPAVVAVAPLHSPLPHVAAHQPHGNSDTTYSAGTQDIAPPKAPPAHTPDHAAGVFPSSAPESDTSAQGSPDGAGGSNGSDVSNLGSIFDDL